MWKPKYLTLNYKLAYEFTQLTFSCSTLPWEIQQSHFNNTTNTHFWLFALSQNKKTVTVTVNLPSPPHVKNGTALPCEMQNLFSSKCWWLWKEPGCDLWQHEYLASNVIASIQCGHPLNGQSSSFFAIDRSHEIHQAAAATRPYRGLALDWYAMPQMR